MSILTEPTPLISPLLHQRLFRSAPSTLNSLPEDFPRSPTNDLVFKDDVTPLSPPLLPDRVIKSVCKEIHYRRNGLPLMFQHSSKYFVCIQSSCLSVRPEILQQTSENGLKAGKRRRSFDNRCGCQIKCKVRRGSKKNRAVWASYLSSGLP